MAFVACDDISGLSRHGQFDEPVVGFAGLDQVQSLVRGRPQGRAFDSPQKMMGARPRDGSSSSSNAGWASNFVHVKPLSKLFRAKMGDGLRKHGLLSQTPAQAWRQAWMVDCRPVGKRLIGAPADVHDEPQTTTLERATEAKVIACPRCGQPMVAIQRFAPS